jgi:hypothetical protein
MISNKLELTKKLYNMKLEEGREVLGKVGKRP